MRLHPGQDWRKNARLDSATKALRGALHGRGRVLIRPSGTEPVLRVMVEAADEQEARQGAEHLAQVVLAG